MTTPVARAGPRPGRVLRGRRLLELVYEHRWFVAVLMLGVVLRAAVWVAYRPTLMEISDAWGYLQLGLHFDFAQHFVLAPDRPLGYPLLLWLLDRPFGFHAAGITLVQHVVGLVPGILAYVICVRFDVRRWLAVTVSAIILLDCYAIALEQTLMPEVWYTTGLVGAAFLVATAGERRWPLFAAGLCLGMTAGVRLAALVAIAAWLVFLAWRYWRRPLVVLVAVAGLALPLVAYAIAHVDGTGRLGYTDASGMFLYGRVAYVADCSHMHLTRETRALCQPKPQRIDDPGVYIWDPQRSPARRILGSWGPTPDEQHRRDRIVGDFARAAIIGNPIPYAKLVVRDFVRFYTPGIQPWGYEADLELPASLPSDPGPLGEAVVPGFRKHARWPAPVLNTVWRVLRTPRWLLAPLTVIAMFTVVLAAGRSLRRRTLGMRRHRETFLFVGMPLLTLLAAAATAQFGVRYMVSVAPMLLIGGALAVEDCVGLWRARRGENTDSVPAES